MVAATRWSGGHGARTRRPTGGARRAGAQTVHLFEPVGRGGIFQHTVAVAAALHAAGTSTVLHTSPDHEDVGVIAAAVCGCARSHRHVRSKLLRGVRVGFRHSVLLTVHLRRAAPAVLHVQGGFALAASLPAVVGLRLGGTRIIFSPHDTVPRPHTLTGGRILRIVARLSACCIVYNRRDADVVRGWGAHAVVVSPLLQVVPPVSESVVQRWHAQWRNGDRMLRVVLLAGHLRPDKRLDLLVAAMRHLGPTFLLAVVGEDRGGRAAMAATSASPPRPIAWTAAFVDLESFVGALLAADVVVCPYDEGGQSGVLALAGAVGTVSVARNVGGLGEQADFLVAGDDPGQLARVIRAACGARPNLRSARDRSSVAVEVHLEAYGRAPGAST